MINGAFKRDGNGVPITVDGLTVSKDQTLTGSNATVATPLFRITGSVEIRAIYAEVITDLGSAHTAAHYRINDQTAQPVLTLVSGTTLSSIKAGSLIVKKGLVGAALVKIDNAAGVISEPTTLETPYFQHAVVTKKTAADTDIEYVYTTSQTPTTGALRHFVRWIPLTEDGSVEAL